MTEQELLSSEFLIKRTDRTDPDFLKTRIVKVVQLKKVSKITYMLCFVFTDRQCIEIDEPLDTAAQFLSDEGFEPITFEQVKKLI